MSDILESIFSSIDAFAYRCVNDKDYTMQFMSGAVRRLIGYEIDDILSNAKVSYVGLTHKDDVEPVFAEVDARIAAHEPWDVAYRLHHADGHLVQVRERGSAVFVDGELAYLQGLVVGAQAETELQSKLHDMLSDSEAKSGEILESVGHITQSLKELNMLSINAQIEAARSGDAGRGFAVVANEMKALSDKNTNRARTIADLLHKQGKPAPIKAPADS